MSENAQINEERLKKFRSMGIPVPVEPVDPAAMRNVNADPEKLRKLEAIRGGANRGTFKEIIEKAEGKRPNEFKALPNPKNRPNPNAPKQPKSEVVVPLNSFAADTRADAEARLLEGALFGDDARATAYSEPTHVENVSVDNRRIPSRETLIQEDTNDDQYGTNFIQRLKAKRTGVTAQATSSAPGIKIMQPIVQPHLRQSSIGISEAELENKIMEIATEIATSVATDVSKNMIKKVITEYAKDGSGIIVESKNVKKAELVGNGVVKISGKIYKLVPVKQSV